MLSLLARRPDHLDEQEDAGQGRDRDDNDWIGGGQPQRVVGRAGPIVAPDARGTVYMYHARTG
jgi:hypothetical protein